MARRVLPCADCVFCLAQTALQFWVWCSGCAACDVATSFDILCSACNTPTPPVRLELTVATVPWAVVEFETWLAVVVLGVAHSCLLLLLLLL